MFEKTSELEEGIRIMNAVEDARFPLMLNRIAQFLSSDISSGSKPFTNTEESKLEVSLEISGREVQLLINTALEIFKICAYHILKPSVLGEQLEKILNLNQKKAEAFVQVWASSAKGIVDNLKHKPYLFQLSHMSYSLSIETASNLQSREKLPKAQLQLALSNDKIRDDVNIEFTHDELYDFYRRLEQIQEQLDALK